MVNNVIVGKFAKTQRYAEVVEHYIDFQVRLRLILACGLMDAKQLEAFERELEELERDVEACRVTG